MHDTANTDRARTTRIALAAAIRVAAGWTALGGLAKLLFGVPSDLPLLLQGVMWPDPATFLALVIGIELFVAALALISPRAGWPAIVAILTLFCAASLYEMARGSANCGCFGTLFSISPEVTLTIDATLAATILSLRPWSVLRSNESMLRRVAPVAGAIGIAVISVAAAMGGPLVAAAKPPVVNRDTESARVRESTAESNGDGKLASNSVQPPAQMPRLVVLAPDSWEGLPLESTELARWIDVSSFPRDASIILYMDTCPHCRDLLSDRANDPASLEYVLVRVPSANPRFPVYVKDDIPSGLRVDLPRGTRWSIVVPWEVIVRDGKVERAVFHKHRRDRSP
jgi:hypothetical protein